MTDGRHWHGTTNAILDLATGGSRLACTDPHCEPPQDDLTITIPRHGTPDHTTNVIVPGDTLNT